MTGYHTVIASAFLLSLRANNVSAAISCMERVFSALFIYEIAPPKQTVIYRLGV